MSASFQPSTFLRYALIGDAVASGATGLLMAAGAGMLSGLLGLPSDLLLCAGLFLLPYAAVVAWLGRKDVLTRGAVWAVITVNALWVAESVLLLASGWVSPTALGYSFVIFQAIVVLAFAEAQFIGLRKAVRQVAAQA